MSASARFSQIVIDRGKAWKYERVGFLIEVKRQSVCNFGKCGMWGFGIVRV